MTTLFKNAKIVLEDRIISGGLLVDGDKIKEIYEGAAPEVSADEIFDCEGKYLAPGFIDVHGHGGDGGYFMSGDREEIDLACKMHLKHGTTSMTPAISAAPYDVIVKSFTGITEYEKSENVRPNFLGLYLEGPYLSPAACGAIPDGYIRLPDKNEYLGLLEKFPNIVRWALAPELPGAVEMVKELTARGVRTSIAHTDAFFDDAEKVREAGLDSITHFYSLTPTVRRKNAYRYAGVVEFGYLYDDIFVEVIADGCHLPAPLLKLIYKCKGSDRIMLVTDGISASGIEEENGKQYYTQMGKPIVIEDGVAKLPTRDSFAGSIATTDRLVRTMKNLAEVPMWEAVKMASATPARYFGIFDKKGSIAPGKDADLVVFDDDVRVSAVFVSGKRLVG